MTLTFKSPRFKSAHFHAHTLIELLVVVSIIVLLMLFMLPTGMKTIGNASILECISRQQNIARTMTTYAFDNHNRYPEGAHLYELMIEKKTVCPEDTDPVHIPVAFFESRLKPVDGEDEPIILQDLKTSYQVNPEYELCRIRADNPGQRKPHVLVYEGFMNLAPTDTATNTTSPITYTHFAPGHASSAQVAQSLYSDLSGIVEAEPDRTYLLGDWVKSGELDTATYIQNDFHQHHGHQGIMIYMDLSSGTKDDMNLSWFFKEPV